MTKRQLKVYLYQICQRKPGSFMTTMTACIVVAANRNKADASIRNEVKNLTSVNYRDRLAVSKRSVKILGPSTIISGP